MVISFCRCWRDNMFLWCILLIKKKYGFTTAIFFVILFENVRQWNYYENTIPEAGPGGEHLQSQRLEGRGRRIRIQGHPLLQSEFKVSQSYLRSCLKEKDTILGYKKLLSIVILRGERSWLVWWAFSFTHTLFFYISLFSLLFLLLFLLFSNLSP